MQQRILIPLDGSRLAEMVLPHALAIAQSTASALTLLRVVPAAGHETDAYLDKVVERVRAAGVAAEGQVRCGDPTDRIVEYAAHDPSVALIAMATHGRHGLERLVLGSVAEQVLQSTPVP